MLTSAEYPHMLVYPRKRNHVVQSEKKLTFLPVAFSNIERSLSVIFSFCFLYFAESTGWPDC